MPRAAGSYMPTAAPPMKRRMNCAAKVGKKMGRMLMTAKMSMPMTICGLREWRSAHQPKTGSKMSLAIGQAAMMRPSCAGSMPCSSTKRGRIGSSAPNPIMTMSSAMSRGSSGPQRRDQADRRERITRRERGITRSVARRPLGGATAGREAWLACHTSWHATHVPSTAMQLIDGQPVYAATDLVGYLACGHLTDLERCALAGLVARPDRPDPELDRIRLRGYEHEQRYKSDLQASGRLVTDLDEPRGTDPWTADRGAALRTRARRTQEAIGRGDDVIFQACFFDGTWLGFADFLLRVERPTPTLPWSYEVADTKLARHVKASAVLQLCSYSEQLARLQGCLPERMHVALGGSARERASFRVDDYMAYFRAVKRRFLEVVGAPPPQAVPAPGTLVPGPRGALRRVPLVARVSASVAAADDDLSLVAGMRGADTLGAAGARRAHAAQPGGAGPAAPAAAGAHAALRRWRACESRRGCRWPRMPPATSSTSGCPWPSRRAASRTRTWASASLPEPSPNDLFLDLEGDPFALDDGVDYLFGLLEPGLSADADGGPAFHAFWSRDVDGRVTAAAEQRAFEQTIDLIMRAAGRRPHACTSTTTPRTSRRTSGSSWAATARGRRRSTACCAAASLVDLFRVVRQGVRVGVESLLHQEAGAAVRLPSERWTCGTPARPSWPSRPGWRSAGRRGQDDGTLARIERYNRDDVVSTWRLRDWLEEQRTLLQREVGRAVPRPQPRSGEASEQLSERLAQVRETAAQLDGRVAGGRRGTGCDAARAAGSWRSCWSGIGERRSPPAGASSTCCEDGSRMRSAARSGSRWPCWSWSGRWRARSAPSATASRPRSTRSASTAAWTR